MKKEERDEKNAEKAEKNLEKAVKIVEEMRKEGTKMKDAVRQVADEMGLKRNELYQAVLDA